MITCQDLGRLSMLIDGEQPPAELLWRKNVALLVYLAHSPNQARTRDHLIGLLWADKPDTAARHSLRESLRTLKSNLGSDAFTTNADQVRFSDDGVTFDSKEFERRCEQERWFDAASLVRGEFLEGFGVPEAPEFENWLTAERLDWRRRSVDVLVRAAQSSIDTADLSTAAELGSRACGLEPGSDAAVRVAMTSLALGGHRSAALQVYDRFAAHMVELDAEPERETAKLVERVKSERQWRVEPVAVAERPAFRRSPLVGRSEELARLTDLWHRCRAGQAGLAIIEGDSGAGKSRLAEELLDRARLDGATAVAARLVEGDKAEPWSALLGLARGGLLEAGGLRGAEPEALAALTAAVPEWAEHFPDIVRDGTACSIARAFRDVVWAAGREQPLIFVLDEAHWVDSDSILALEAAIRDLRDTPMLLLLTVNPAHSRSEIDTLLAQIDRDLTGASIRLRTLAADALRELIAQIMTDYDQDQQERLERRLAVDSGGIPLLAVELLHAVQGGLEFGNAEAQWPQPLRTLDQTLPSDLPDSIIGAIRVGFRRFSAAAQSVLRVIATAGDLVPVEAIARGSGLEPEPLATALDELEWERWLKADPRGYSFVARIVGDVVVENMVTAGQRQRILDAITPAEP